MHVGMLFALKCAVAVTLLAGGAIYGPAACADGANVLAVETIMAKSHWNFMSAVLRALTDSGRHTVTVFTPFPEGDRDNYTEVDVSGGVSAVVGIDLAALTSSMSTLSAMVSFATDFADAGCAALHDNGRLKEIAAARFRGFDAVLAEPLAVDCLSHMAAGSGLPLIYVVPTAKTFARDIENFGHFPNPATVAPVMADHAVPRTFARRMSNAAWHVYFACLMAFRDVSRGLSRVPRPYEANVTTPPALVFVNSHFISDAPRPTTANLVPVGGIHLKPAGTIPEDILEFIEGSPHGVIFFTFGSTVLMSTIPENILRAFIEALAQLPQRVLFKYEHEMEDKPKNIMTKKWFPQRDILVHPNVKLFISHGGISGVYEAVDAGVPVLGFPLFADQHRNIANLEEAGMAISMEILSVSKDAFLKNVVDLVNDKKYTINAKIASKIFKDRPMSPEKSVVYWTEYVIRHKGAPHLKSQGRNLTWYQYFLLDVIAAMLIIIFIVLCIIYKIRKVVYGFIYECIRYLTKAKSE